MKVGIIGGGLAGLTCAYRLSQKNINPIIFEQEPVVGGRILYNIGAISKDSIHLNTQALIEELGLDELYTSLELKSLGLLYGRFLLKAENALKVIKWLFPPRSKKYFNNLMDLVFRLNFDLKSPSPELIELRSISFAEYLKDCPKLVKTFCIDGDLNFAHEADYSKIAADYALHIVRHAFDMMILGKDYVFEENLVPLVNVLEKKIKEVGVPINTSATVSRVTRSKQDFQISYNKDNQEKTEKVDKIVFATTPAMSQTLMKELKIECDVYYNKVKCVLTKGELKYDRKILGGIRDKDKSNIAIFSTALPYEHLVIAFDADKEINFNAVYKKNKYEIVREKTMDGAMPVRPPKGRVPELETNVKGVYLCGDFYYYGLLETSVATANMVAKMIKPGKDK